MSFIILIKIWLCNSFERLVKNFHLNRRKIKMIFLPELTNFEVFG